MLRFCAWVVTQERLGASSPTNASAATRDAKPRMPRLKNRLDFCRKGRIAMGAGRWTWPPGETLRARLAMCGALGRANVNSDARTNGAQYHVDPFHREVQEPQERRTQEGKRQIERDISAQGHVRHGQHQDAVEGS